MLPMRPVPQEKPEACQDCRSLVLPELPKGRSDGSRVAARGTSMPFVKCSVDGCSRKLQPLLKVDPRDRDTWFYRECDVCFRPACEKHSVEVEGRIVCDRCRREAEVHWQSAGLIDLGFLHRPEPE